MNFKITIFIIGFTSIIFSKGYAQTSPGIQLPAIFSDNMVLQQGATIPIWGKARAGTHIKIELAGQITETVVQTDDSWQAKIPALKAGGPYLLSVIGKDTVQFTDVMIGEVWLASGQSNMNFNVANLANKNQILAEARDANVREFDVTQRVSEVPQSNLKGKWLKASSADVVSFSAVAYLFATHLHRDKNVAVGIIHASWGGTPIESWISSSMLLLHPDFRDSILHLQQKKDDWYAGNELTVKANSERKLLINSTKEGILKKVNQNNFNDKSWPTTSYPIISAKMPIHHYRLIWLRKAVTLPENISTNTPLKLSLGAVSDQDITYFNGTEVGRGTTAGKRVYNVPGTLVKPGKNTIAVRYLCEYGYEKIGNNTDEPFIGSQDTTLKISLLGEWKYNDQVEPALPWGTAYQNLPSALFNGMIVPLIPFGIKGVLWYQGESNADRAEQYKALQPMLFTDWRMRWANPNLPFLFVQLPNFKAGTNWPAMREAQAYALKFHHIGMAVSIDAGDPGDVHPKNKDAIAYRLFLQAKKNVYNDPHTISSGPVFKSMVIEHDTLVLTFDQTGRGLNKVDTLKGFSIAGSDKIFHTASAVIKGNKVIIFCGNVYGKPEIRYAWAPNPECNLYNVEGLPAAPFRTDNW